MVSEQGAQVPHPDAHLSYAPCCCCLRIIKLSLGLMYMFPKYTLRYFFWRAVGRGCGGVAICEVRNPNKAHKRAAIARQYGVEVDVLERSYQRTRVFFFLLP